MNAKQTEWDDQNESVLDVLILSVAGAAEALVVYQYRGRRIYVGTGVLFPWKHNPNTTKNSRARLMDLNAKYTTRVALDASGDDLDELLLRVKRLVTRLAQSHESSSDNKQKARNCTKGTDGELHLGEICDFVRHSTPRGIQNAR